MLDEVRELSPGAQAKLLRILQDGEYTSSGNTTPNDQLTETLPHYKLRHAGISVLPAAVMCSMRINTERRA